MASATEELDDEEHNSVVSLRSVTDYFSQSHQLASSPPDTVPLPLRSFSLSCIAFNLAYDPHICRISVDQAAEQFGLPDLRAALADFLSFEKSCGMDLVHPIGGGPHRAPTNTELSFTDIQVWFKLRLQMSEIHTNTVLPAQTIFASLPKGEWKCGRYDLVVVNIDDTKVWPTSSLEGMASDFTVPYTLHQENVKVLI